MEAKKGRDLERSDSTVTVSALIDEDYRQMEMNLKEDGSNTGDVLQFPDPCLARAEDVWTPESLTNGAIGRADTLELHPGFVNPREVEITRPVGEVAENDFETYATTPAGSQPHQQETFHVEVSLDGGGVVKDEDIGEFQHTMLAVDQNDKQVLSNLFLNPHMFAQHGCNPVNQPVNATATSLNPSMMPWPGIHQFQVNFQRLTDNAKNKSWDYSTPLQKLFIDMNKAVMASFHVGSNPPDGLYIRALPMYAIASFFQDSVKRCPNHSAPEDSSNEGFPLAYREHLIRVNHDGAVYEEDDVSKRLSVRVPVEKPQSGTETSDFSLKFMCLGSDVGGINRKPLKVIFTLEDSSSVVVGRCSVDVRICSCPKRDKLQEERRLAEETEKLGRIIAKSRPCPEVNPPLSKKRKLDKDFVEDIMMVPVAKADYEKLNEFAEGAMIARHLDKVQEIKHIRRRLLERYNPGIFSKESTKK